MVGPDPYHPRPFTPTPDPRSRGWGSGVKRLRVVGVRGKGVGGLLVGNKGW